MNPGARPRTRIRLQRGRNLQAPDPDYAAEEWEFTIHGPGYRSRGAGIYDPRTRIPTKRGREFISRD